MGLPVLTEVPQETNSQGLVAEPVFQTATQAPSVNDENIPAAANDGVSLDQGAPTSSTDKSALSQVATIGTVIVPTEKQGEKTGNESLVSFADGRVKSVKTVGGEVKKTVSPETILNASLQNQIATLHSQIQNLLEQIKGERTQAQKTILDATLKVQNDIAKLRNLLQNKDEEITSNRELIEKLNDEIRNLKEKIVNLGLELKEADTFMSGHPNLLETNLMENKSSGGLEVQPKVELHPMVATLLSRVEVLQNTVLRVATATLNDRAYMLTDGGLSGGTREVERVGKAAAQVGSAPATINQVTIEKVSLSNAPTIGEATLPLATTSQVVPEFVATSQIAQKTILVDNDLGTTTERETMATATEAHREEGEANNFKVPSSILSQSEADTASLPRDNEAVEVTSPVEPTASDVHTNESKPTKIDIDLKISKVILNALGAAGDKKQDLEAALDSPLAIDGRKDLDTVTDALRMGLATRMLPATTKEAFEKFKGAGTADIYLSSGVFNGTKEERLALSAFIKELLVFFIPSHNASLSEHEIAAILSTSTLEILWTTCCTLYAEEVEKSKNSIAGNILERLDLHKGSDEERLASLIDIRDLTYTNYFSALLSTEAETPVIEALRKAYEMDGKEKLLNKDHNYDFFCIALKNFLLNKEQGVPLTALFEKVREETILSLTTEETGLENSTLPAPVAA